MFPGFESLTREIGMGVVACSNYYEVNVCVINNVFGCRDSAPKPKLFANIDRGDACSRRDRMKLGSGRLKFWQQHSAEIVSRANHADAHSVLLQ